jgi:hypothetical protein
MAEWYVEVSNLVPQGQLVELVRGLVDEMDLAGNLDE